MLIETGKETSCYNNRCATLHPFGSLGFDLEEAIQGGGDGEAKS